MPLWRTDRAEGGHEGQEWNGWRQRAVLVVVLRWCAERRQGLQLLEGDGRRGGGQRACGR